MNKKPILTLVLILGLPQAAEARVKLAATLADRESGVVKISMHAEELKATCTGKIAYATGRGGSEFKPFTLAAATNRAGEARADTLLDPQAGVEGISLSDVQCKDSDTGASLETLGFWINIEPSSVGEEIEVQSVAWNSPTSPGYQCEAYVVTSVNLRTGPSTSTQSIPIAVNTIGSTARGTQVPRDAIKSMEAVLLNTACVHAHEWSK